MPTETTAIWILQQHPVAPATAAAADRMEVEKIGTKRAISINGVSIMAMLMVVLPLIIVVIGHGRPSPVA